MAIVLDAISAAHIVAALSDPMGEVVVRHVVQTPDRQDFVEGVPAWRYRKFAETADAVTAQDAKTLMGHTARLFMSCERACGIVLLNAPPAASTRKFLKRASWDAGCTAGAPADTTPNAFRACDI